MRDVNDLILPYLRQQCNILKIGFAGYCYGGYVAYLVSQQENILSCAAGCHSSIRIFNLHGSNETEATIKVTCPQMLLQAGNDNPSGKVGSEVHQILSSKPFGDKCVLQEFPEMLHGWVPRGDLSDPKVVRDVTEAMRLVIEFLNTHMQ
jgi:dienelactone hydrolase